MTDTKSQVLTDVDAGLKLNPIKRGATVREAAAVVAVPASDVSDTFRMVRLESRARLSELLLTTDGAGTAGAATVGVYGAVGGAAVDGADNLAAAITLSTAAVNTDAMSALTPTERTQRLWEVLGLSEDPGVEYDIVLTVSTEVTGADTSVSLVARYVLDE